MKITVTLDTSETESTHTFSLEQLGKSLQEWQAMDNEQKRECLQDAIDEMPSQPYWMLDKFKEKL